MANIVITIPQNGGEKKYTLEFTRRIILKMEEEKVIDSLKKGASQESFDKLVYYACLKNQPNITLEEAQAIVDSVALSELGKFIDAIAKLLNSSIDALEKEGKEGNAHWEVN